MQHHPDKVGEDDRENAEVRFKQISEAYEILYDDQKKDMYDMHGMSAFDRSSGPATEPDLEDILEQMFGFNMGGGGGMPGAGQQGPRKGADEKQQYTVTLEDLYKGKTVKFSSVKNVICVTCHGKGGKERAKPKQCSTCKGRGMLRSSHSACFVRYINEVIGQDRNNHYSQRA